LTIDILLTDRRKNNSCNSRYKILHKKIHLSEKRESEFGA
jgi:hypothetical protein